MWAIFKLAVLRFLTITVMVFFLASALSATISSTINPTIPIIHAGSEAATLTKLDEMPASITISSELIFFGSLFFASLMLLWKKGSANITKALAVGNEIKLKLNKFASDESNEEDKHFTLVADDMDSIVYLTIGNDNKQITRADWLSLPQISSQPTPSFQLTTEAELLNNQKKLLIAKFTELAIQMRIGRLTDISDAMNAIDDTYFQFSDADKESIRNNIEPAIYFELINKVDSPISRWENIKSNIAETLYGISTYLTIPGEIALSAFGVFVSLLKIPAMTKNISISLASLAGFLSSGMTAAVLYDTKKTRKNVLYNDALKSSSSLVKKILIQYGGIVSGLGSATVDWLITDTAIVALFGKNYSEYNYLQDAFIACLYIMVGAIAYRKIISTIDQMEDTFNQEPNIFYKPPKKRSIFEWLRDISVPLEKAISSSLATAVQMYGLFGSYEVSLILALNTLICTIAQVIAVTRTAVKEQDPNILVMNKLIFNLLGDIFEKLMVTKPNPIEKKKFVHKFEKALAQNLADPNTDSSVAGTLQFTFFNKSYKQTKVLPVSDNNLQINNSTSPLLLV